MDVATIIEASWPSKKPPGHAMNRNRIKTRFYAHRKWMASLAIIGHPLGVGDSRFTRNRWKAAEGPRPCFETAGRQIDAG